MHAPLLFWCWKIRIEYNLYKLGQQYCLITSWTGWLGSHRFEINSSWNVQKGLDDYILVVDVANIFGRRRFVCWNQRCLVYKTYILPHKHLSHSTVGTPIQGLQSWTYSLYSRAFLRSCAFYTKSWFHDYKSWSSFQSHLSFSEFDAPIPNSTLHIWKAVSKHAMQEKLLIIFITSWTLHLKRFPYLKLRASIRSWEVCVK